MKRLYLLRHAKSSWDDPALADRDRPLAPRGRKAARRIARYAEREEIRPELVLCSPAVRARATLDRVGPALGPAADVRVEEGLYGASDDELLARLRRLPDHVASVLVVGHNPALQQLAELLTGLDRPFPTGALATISIRGRWADLGSGSSSLAGYVVPRELS